MTESFLAKARALREERERPLRAVPDPFDTPTRRNGSGQGYAQTALAGEVERVRATPTGSRNHALNRAAFSLGQLVAGGELTQHEVVSALTHAARQAGLDEKEIGPTIASGLGDGMATPRTAPRDLYGTASGGAPTPPAPVDDEAFWTARPALAAIRSAARERLVSPWATLGGVLAHVCSRIGPHVVLPPIVGGVASLNTFWAFVGPSGAGKDAALAVAHELLWLDDTVPTHEVGTGQGIDSTYTTQTKKDGPVQFCDAALFTVTEIDTLAGHASMGGSTILATLRKVYSGSALGARYADKEKRRPVRAHRYRAALVAGVQPARSGVLLADADGGTPQRWLWLPTNDPGAGELEPVSEFDQPRQGLWQQFENLQAFGEMDDDVAVPQRRRVEIKVCDTARTAIVEQRRARLTAPLIHADNDLNGHALLTRLKVAALLALFDSGRSEVNEDDWELSGVVIAMSDATRDLCSRTLAEAARKANTARALQEIEREDIAVDSREKRVAQALLRILTRAGDWVSRAELRNRRMATRDKPYFESAMARLVAAGSVEAEEFEAAGAPKGERFRVTQKRS